ncbi:regulator of nonsense transcripts 3A [Drosophila subobscura]|uniref:regulator of nonsense transcripts 3A n=1 Tax=Drosophila subobscura TaxID=7241 RepID=UPI00155A7437|nr:regulator of nonsense transcripts 3A [Drosophila subobscura]
MSEIKDEKQKTSNPESKPERSRGNKRKDRKEKANPTVKIVIRHLPPTMTEQEFLDQVGPLPESDSYYFCQADWSLGHDATCRAYIDMTLKDNTELLQFRDRFDGYVFVDQYGVEYHAMVEYAPFQCFLKNKSRTDDKVNTIESEPHYQAFLQKLADEREEATRMGEVKIDLTFDRKSDDRVRSTPLLQYLANKKEKRREEARKRNEEKKKHREEQKQVRLMEQNEISKPKEAGADAKKDTGTKPKAGGKDNQSQNQTNDGNKNSRSKRRTERDQRRREEHEQRKLDRDRDQKDGKIPQRQENTDKEKPSSYKNGKKTKQLKDFNKTERDIAILRKENKSDVKKCEVPSGSKKSVVDDPTQAPEKNEETNAPDTGKKSTQAVSDQSENENSAATTVKQAAPSRSKSFDETRKSSFRSSEERRIRNKDRPSIAIYQPKVRTRKGSGDGNKDATKPRDEPLSDGEVSIVEEKSSARRNKRPGRRNKSKPSEGVSKSSENSCSAPQNLLAVVK